MLKGVYTYNIPQSVLSTLPDTELTKITEDPASYEHFPHADEVELLIARQGAVNRMLEFFPNVRWLQLLNAGYEKVDLQLLKQRGICFTNARSVYCNTIAEDVIAKILILSRKYMVHFSHQQQCFWPNDDQLPNYNLDLSGKRLLIRLLPMQKFWTTSPPVSTPSITMKLLTVMQWFPVWQLAIPLT